MFRATPQWFIGMDSKDLLKRSSSSIENVLWEPDWGKARMASMLKQDLTGVFETRTLGRPNNFVSS